MVMETWMSGVALISTSNSEARSSMTPIKDMMLKTIKRFDTTDDSKKVMLSDLSVIVQKEDAHAISIKKNLSSSLVSCTHLWT